MANRRSRLFTGREAAELMGFGILVQTEPHIVLEPGEKPNDEAGGGKFAERPQPDPADLHAEFIRRGITLDLPVGSEDGMDQKPA